MFLSNNSTYLRNCLLAFLLLLAFSALLQAEERKWYEAYQVGVRMEKEGKYEHARKAFLIAATLRPEPSVRIQSDRGRTLLHYDPYIHLAICELRLGMYQEAAEHLDQSDAAGVTPLALRTRVRRQLEEAGARSGTSFDSGLEKPDSPRQPAGSSQRDSVLELESSPPGAQIRVDGVAQGKAPLRIRVTPGVHQVEHDMEGFQSGSQSVTVKPGEHLRLFLHLAPEETIGQEKPPPAETTQVASQPESVSPAPQPEPAPEVPSDTGLQEPAVQQNEFRRQVSRPGTGTMILIGLLAVIAVSSTAFWIKNASRSRTDSFPPRTDPTRVMDPASASTQLETYIPVTPTHRAFDSSVPPPAISTPTTSPLEELKPLAKPLPVEISREFGDYFLHGIFGRGGMGTTYLAVRMRDKLPVALKVPHDHLLDHDEFIRRFLREGALGSTLHHPNIIRIYEAGKVARKPFIAMEALQGETLWNRLKEGNHLPIREALEIARDIALSLDYARLKGIVHRDLKPDNIMLLQRGGLKVMDYGIARIMDLPGLTATDYYLGTPAYSAPEAATGDTDQQSDLYSLGIILFRMLTGNLPFPGKTSVEIFHGHLHQPLPLFAPELNIPATVRNLVEVLAAKQKSDRYAHAEAFLIDLNQVLNQLDA